MSVGHAGEEIGGSRTQRGQAHPGLARHATVRRGHEGGRLFMAHQHQLNGRGAQRLHEVDVFLAGEPHTRW